MDFTLISASFIAGVLMFLAPCTLPLLPGYLAFISGVEPKKIKEAQKDKDKMRTLQVRVVTNGFMYVLGFSVVFVAFGALAGLIGAAAIGQYRVLLTRVGGVFVILFGLFMLNIIKVKGLSRDKKVEVPAIFQKGRPSTSFLLGVAFAIGWTPCIGPILASILLLASTSGTVPQGAFLLGVFSIGLAIPFLFIAWGIGSAYERIEKIHVYMPIISKVGGVFLVVLGVLLFTNNLGLLISLGYDWFDFLGYEKLLDYY